MSPPGPSTPDRKLVRILVVDDHPIMRDGITQLVSQEPDLTVCAEARNRPEALAAIEASSPDLAIVDVSLGDDGAGNGIDLIKDVKARHPDLPVLVLSMHEESLYAERSLRAGARGYITKQESPAKVMEAIRRVLDGKIYVSDETAERVLERIIGGDAVAGDSPTDRMSDRELEVFRLIGQGARPRHIAERLHVSVKTVESYCARIKLKLNLTNATELVEHAFQWVQSQAHE